MVPGGFLRFFMFFYGSRLVFCDYRSVFVVFDNSKLVSMVFHCSRLAFHSEFSLFFCSSGLVYDSMMAFMVPGFNSS